MTLITYDIKKQHPFILIAVLSTGILLSFPVRMFIADCYYSRAFNIIDDRSTEYLDVQTVSGDTIADYLAAIQSLENAATVEPSNVIYYKALADIYRKLGTWAETMNALKASLPQNAVSSKDAFEQAKGYLKKAVYLEPTNPDYHFALGQLYDETKDASQAEKEIRLAALAYPVNAPLRYAIARHYLLTGRSGDALEQARILADMDESYIVPESIDKTLVTGRRTPYYVSLLSESYLFKALEIAWRVSKDPAMVKWIAPNNPDAREVLKLFLETEGIEE